MEECDRKRIETKKEEIIPKKTAKMHEEVFIVAKLPQIQYFTIIMALLKETAIINNVLYIKVPYGVSE